MDHYGIFGRRLSPGPDESRQFRGDAHSGDSEGGSQRSGLSAQRTQAPPRY